MKPIFKLMAASMLCLSLFSCTEDVIDPIKPPVVPPTPEVPDATYLGIDATIANMQQTKAGIITAFKDNEKIGLFVTDGELGSNYNNNAVAANMASTYLMGEWSVDNNLEVSSEGSVFAYYPHDVAKKDGLNIPIETKTQTDYLYSAKSNISKSSPKAAISMKHALSLVSVRIRKNDYQYIGNLDRVELIGLQEEGTLNIATGTVTKTGEVGAVVREPNIILNDDMLDAQKTSSIVLPTNIADNAVKMQVTIDGRKFTYDVPNMHNWVAGMEYIYTLNLGEVTEDKPIVELDVAYWTKFGKDDNIVIKDGKDNYKFRIEQTSTPYGRTIVQNESFIFNTGFTKSDGAWNGKVKYTLWQGDKMIEQYPAYRVKDRTWGEIRIGVFVTVPAGQYRLVPLYQEDGQTEWTYAYDRASEESDWYFNVIEDNTAPSTRWVSLVDVKNSESFSFVDLNKSFDVEYTLTNRGNVPLKGEVKAVWMRSFTNEFNLERDDDGNTWEDEVGRVSINLGAGEKEMKGIIPSVITKYRDAKRYGCVLRLYYKAEGSNRWIHMRHDGDSDLQHLKGEDTQEWEISEGLKRDAYSYLYLLLNEI